MAPSIKSRSAFAIATLALAVAIGAAVGTGGYTFVYAKGYSYLQDDPTACANCHVMENHYAGWTKSSHRSVATCNDCHAPTGLVAKYVNKADNGFWHGLKFTTGEFKDPIQIRAHNREITEAACRNCHGALVDQMDTAHADAEGVSCIRCHGSVGHPDDR
ncbi:cytochrome c nitrite reductase small subunit [Vulgatibacter sp.]|uniref:cytochrome c nitrite reductase small subunit n=1 Tax=Vulgatibacter sp. TaxID=1971226 RepID=UPI003564178F